MENKEQKIKMLDAINELHILNEDFERKHSEAFSRYMKLCDAIENTKELIAAK